MEVCTPPSPRQHRSAGRRLASAVAADWQRATGVKTAGITTEPQSTLRSEIPTQSLAYWSSRWLCGSVVILADVPPAWRPQSAAVATAIRRQSTRHCHNGGSVNTVIGHDRHPQHFSPQPDCDLLWPGAPKLRRNPCNNPLQALDLGLHIDWVTMPDYLPSRHNAQARL
jgi:hypothetical protein